MQSLEHDMESIDEDGSKTSGGKSPRPVRNRRYSRKSFSIGQKTVKRLFTPEIKRFLKEWLVRRRDNPYPNREEKKQLAIETGLTYIQICNWFANWRRKLKNVSSERRQKTWGHLIKTYNNRARGNVEQFSLCSEDSIWEEADPISSDASSDLNDDRINKCDKIINTEYEFTKNKSEISAKCGFLNSVLNERKTNVATCKSPGNKYKNHIMEKYLKGLEIEMCNKKHNDAISRTENKSQPFVLGKWLQSAANFQPSCVTSKLADRQNNEKIHSYLKTLNNNEIKNENAFFPNRFNNVIDLSKLYKNTFEYTNKDYNVCNSFIHGREEVEAAVALTRLAGTYRS